jgi:hypothetical protein
MKSEEAAPAEETAHNATQNDQFHSHAIHPGLGLARGWQAKS